jgi:hypothetical protein
MISFAMGANLFRVQFWYCIRVQFNFEILLESSFEKLYIWYFIRVQFRFEILLESSFEENDVYMVIGGAF